MLGEMFAREMLPMRLFLCLLVFLTGCSAASAFNESVTDTPLTSAATPTPLPDIDARYVDETGQTSDEILALSERILVENYREARERYAFDDQTSAEALAEISDSIRRDFLEWLHVPGEHAAVIDDLETAPVISSEEYSQSYVVFTNANGLTIRGLVSIPRRETDRPFPVMVVNFASAESNNDKSMLDLDSYYPPANGAPEKFAEDYVVFALEIPNGYKDEMFLFSTAGGFNAQYYSMCDRVSSAVDYIATLPEADMTRVGIYGVSNGGLTAITAAVCDERLSAIAASGTNDFTSILTQITSNRRFRYPSFHYYDIAEKPDYYEAMYSFFPRLVIMELHPLDDTGVYEEALVNAQRIQHYYSLRGQPEQAHIVILPEDRCADKVRHHCMGIEEVKRIFDGYFEVESIN